MVGGFVALACLTGCSGLAEATPWTTTAGETIGAEAVAQPSEPVEGACWNLTYADVLAEPSYPLGNEVSCSSPHQSYTFSMVQIPASGADESTTAQLAEEQSEAEGGCAVEYTSMFPAESANHQNRVLFEAFLSATVSGTTGQHWARCDLEELAVGSNFFQPTLANLPDYSTLATELRAHPADWALCANTPGSNGSTGPNIGTTTTVGDCTSAQWRLESSTDRFPDPIGTPYPGYKGLFPFMHAHCGALYDSAAIKAWDYFPEESQWDSGSRVFSCWIGKR